MTITSILSTELKFSTVLGGSVGTVTVGFLIYKGIEKGLFLKWLANFSEFARRQYSKVSIRKSINHAMQTEEIRSLGIVSKKVRLEFANDLRIDDLSDGETVIVALNSTTNNPKNIALATIQAVSQNLFPQSALTLTKDIEKGVSFALAKKAFSTNSYIAADKYFDSHILADEYLRNPNFEKIMVSLEEMDKLGVFSRVLVQQYCEVNRKKFETFAFSAIQQETTDFLKFIHEIATREEYDTKTPLKFYREHIKVKVFLVASSTSAKNGADGLIRRLDNEKIANHVYLIFPAINRNMVDRGHIPVWNIYSSFLKLIREGTCKFVLTSEPKKFEVIGKKKYPVKVAVVFVERNG